ncbi:hypothetical protein E4631_22765 [Hymenobacter sp. UV11]|uniref:hypothetical protein n=1 Tax=Hymenobacter sp. UV11 TaxID=1849735 RepID=UPI0010602FA7|nr:hypothetical protein [Hymenobacter sp. UV11]TFZ63318.1 hypothetical protein E4631_22765 [Hymenobacter sp. UV11]
MKKIKGQGTLVKLLASKIADSHRNEFGKHINIMGNLGQLASSVAKSKCLDIQIISFSSTKDFNEQIFSILSFIRYVGTPASWIIYSDGTHINTQIQLIESAFSFIKIIKTSFDNTYFQANVKPSLLPYLDELIHYCRTAPLGKRLFLYLNFEIIKPTIFLDSDVVFYEKSSCLERLLGEDSNGWFLPDEVWGTLDSRYTKITPPQHYQVNAGFFIANRNFTEVSQGLSFLKSLGSDYEYFSEQTVIHIVLHANKFMPLDPRTFILNNADQFDFLNLRPFKQIALRHYTSPVRHKMWQTEWRTQLGIIK